MGKTGNITIKGMKELQKNLEKLQSRDNRQFIEECAKELAARLLFEAAKRTPEDCSVDLCTCEAGRAYQGHKAKETAGAALRRGWTIGEVRNEGGIYKIDVINPVAYASCVEYGYRAADHGGWVQGHFMLTASEQEIRDIAPELLEIRIRKYLEGVFL